VGDERSQALLSSDDLARLRAEERARQEIRAALAPPPAPASRFERLLALANTNVGIGTVAALLLSVLTWCYTVLDDHLHKAERQAARDSAKALVDVQQVSPFLPMLAKPDSAERALACRVLAHMIASGSIDKTLGTGLAAEAGNCLAEQARRQAATGGETLASSNDAIKAVDRREPSGALAAEGVAETAGQAAQPAEINAAQAALARALPRRVYIQYADDGQLDEVRRLRAFYEAKGWLVPATQRVAAQKAPQQLQVRYFNDADRQAAEQTQRDLAAMAPFDGWPQAEAPRRVPLTAPPGQLEVWLPRPQ
jgi:hypothetical protein